MLKYETFTDIFALIPIVTFVAISQWYGYTDAGWKLAFLIAGGLALAYSITSYISGVVVDRFIMAVNLFLMIGGIAFLANITPILTFYQLHTVQVVWLSLIIVGCVTLFTKPGYIGITDATPPAIRKASLQLLAATFVIVVVAYLLSSFISSSLVVATGLFIALRLVRSVLIMRMMGDKQSF